MVFEKNLSSAFIDSLSVEVGLSLLWNAKSLPDLRRSEIFLFDFAHFRFDYVILFLNYLLLILK